MNILITGCRGQLGTELCLLQKLYGTESWFNTDAHELDVTDKEQIKTYISKNRIDGIVNCAAYTAVDKAESDIEQARILNSNAPSYLAEAIEKRNGWMIQISTDYVFDGMHNMPYFENETSCPNTVYGKTKLEGEMAVLSNCKKSMIIRTAWLYSPYGNNFVKTMLRLGSEKKQVGVVYDQIGSPTYAGDLAEAIMKIITQGISPGIYHYTNEGVASWYDFTKSIFELAKLNECGVFPIRTSEYPTLAKRPQYSVLDKSKIKNAYKLDIPYWRKSLEKCLSKLVKKDK